MNSIPDIIIAVDGYSSTGKSTFAKMVASEFGFLYLDSGAMYRGVTFHCLEEGLIGEDGSIDEARLQGAIDLLDLHFRRTEGFTRLFLGERCIESEIRTMEVSSYVSPVSAIPFVRQYVDRRLHTFSEGGRVIMDGRDIGTVIMPNADVKIFYTATAETRAERRFREQRERGMDVTYEEILAAIEARDKQDSERETAPLKPADDAIVFYNDPYPIDACVCWVLGVLYRAAWEKARG